jgi:hypothetical protein
MFAIGLRACLKIEELGKLVEHDADHGEEDPGFGSVEGFFVIADETAMANDPGKGALDNPSSGQDLESGYALKTMDDFHSRPWPLGGNPVGKLRPAEPSVGPNSLDAMTLEHRSEQSLGSASLGSIGRCDFQAKKVAQSIDAQEAFAALGLLGCIVADRPSMGIGAHGLAVDNDRAGMLVSAQKGSQQLAQLIVDFPQQTAKRPVPKVMINCLPGRKIHRQHPPRTPAFEHEKDGIEHPAQARPRSATPGLCRQKTLHLLPLELRQTGLVLSNFHRSKTASRKSNRSCPLLMSTHFCSFNSYFSDRL